MNKEMIRTLEALPTIHSGHTGNLKLDNGERRLWVERGWEEYEPGECRAVTIERLIDGCWEDVTGEGDTMIDRCVGCNAELWQLARQGQRDDPAWEGRDYSEGKPGTVITNDDETREVPACLECANDQPIYHRIREEHSLN